MRASHLTKEQSTAPPATSQTKTTRSGDERNNHEATAPPTSLQQKHQVISYTKIWNDLAKNVLCDQLLSSPSKHVNYIQKKVRRISWFGSLFSGTCIGQTEELSMPLVVQKDISWCLLNIKRSRIETKTRPVDRENFQISWLQRNIEIYRASRIRENNFGAK